MACIAQPDFHFWKVQRSASGFPEFALINPSLPEPGRRSLRPTSIRPKKPERHLQASSPSPRESGWDQPLLAHEILFPPNQGIVPALALPFLQLALNQLRKRDDKG